MESFLGVFGSVWVRSLFFSFFAMDFFCRFPCSGSEFVALRDFLSADCGDPDLVRVVGPGSFTLLCPTPKGDWGFELLVSGSCVVTAPTWDALVDIMAWINHDLSPVFPL